MPDDLHTCPRRSEDWRPLPDGQADTWRRRGRADQPRTCSYCGSLHPGDFLDLALAGAQLGPTDKDYKVYVDWPDPDAGVPWIYASANFEKTDPDWLKVTDENVATLPGDGHPIVGHYVCIEPKSATQHGKFYFPHLDEAQKRQFVELLNAKRLTIGSPGHFYRLPFFAVSEP